MTWFGSSAVLLHVLLYANAQFYGGQQSDCETPVFAPGLCIGIRECPELLQRLQARPLRSEDVEYLRKSQCGFTGRDPKVCCAISNSVPTTTESGLPNPNQENRQQISLNNTLLPTDCGKDVSQRIIGGERTDLDEFPWMALLEYTKPNGRTTACGGVLISKRYVLTAAHCIKGKDLPKTWNLVAVRLGEYDTSTERDCISDGVGEDSVCADDPLTVGIEEQIAHEDYKPLARDQRNDIALLRLSRDVKFTEYVKPICLPKNFNLEKTLYVAGWGKTETKSESNVKLKLRIPPVEFAQCSTVYGRASVTLGAGQICAGGEKGKDSCRGDSGGPLMSIERLIDGYQWSAIGVVSFGPSPCGMQGWPGVYTKVADYVPWIIRNMRS